MTDIKTINCETCGSEIDVSKENVAFYACRECRAVYVMHEGGYALVSHNAVFDGSGKAYVPHGGPCMLIGGFKSLF